jgi:hypothetical protein
VPERRNRHPRYYARVSRAMETGGMETGGMGEHRTPHAPGVAVRDP